MWTFTAAENNSMGAGFLIAHHLFNYNDRFHESSQTILISFIFTIHGRHGF